MNWYDQRPDDAMAGAFEAIAPEPVVAVEAPIFREAMSLYGSAVHVVTTDGPGGKTGFTATAICSVSDNPPTLLVCLNRKSQGSPLLAANRVFCVNTLGAGQEAISNMFATGAPVLSSAIVACDCRVVEIKAVASHNVIFGVVEAVHLGTAGPALVYHGRVYKSV